MDRLRIIRRVLPHTSAACGFGDEDASRVFERFYRIDPSRSREHGGAGLDLGIVAAIVAAHGGTVSASATPDGGATFTVKLPLDETEG